jgi:sterol desaturase/sphingolipid hydroxylase (fatty acid hydroxylase superfamily)
MGQGGQLGGDMGRELAPRLDKRAGIVVAVLAIALTAEVFMRGGPLGRHVPVALVQLSLTRTLALVLLAAVFVPLERLFPRRELPVFRTRWRGDVVYFFVNNFFASAGTVIVVVAVGFGLRALVPHALHDAIGAQSIEVQFVEAFLLSEIAEYWAHRTMHVVPFMWRFHKVHHGITEMDWLASARLHPVDRAFTRSSAYLPLFVLGFSTSTIGLFAVFAAVQALAVHANVRFTFGPLSYLLATPQYHHWHHDADAATNKNFAAKLPLVDWMFGSLYLPKRAWPTRYGIDETSPESYVGQLLWPFASTKAVAEPASGSSGSSAVEAA